MKRKTQPKRYRPSEPAQWQRRRNDRLPRRRNGQEHLPELVGQIAGQAADNEAEPPEPLVELQSHKRANASAQSAGHEHLPQFSRHLYFPLDKKTELAKNFLAVEFI